MEQASSQRKPLKRQNLASMLVDDLRKRLLCGEFSGGTLLRQEQLAQEYGVSRMPVREAIHWDVSCHGVHQTEHRILHRWRPHYEFAGTILF